MAGASITNTHSGDCGQQLSQLAMKFLAVSAGDAMMSKESQVID